MKEMQLVVDAICKSLLEEPNEWRFGVHDIQHKTKFNHAMFWRPSFTDLWTGQIKEEIFTSSQGRQIQAAYKKCLLVRGTDAQLALLDSIGNPEYIEKPEEPGWFFKLLKTVRS